MKDIRILMILVALFYVGIEAQAQWYKDLRYEAEVAYLWGIAEKSNLYKIKQSDWNIDACSFQLNVFYEFERVWDAGLGLRMAQYIGTKDDMLGIMAVTKYRPLRNLPKAFIMTGYGCNCEDEHCFREDVCDLAIGYEWNMKKTMSLNVKLGYNYTHFKREIWDGDSGYYKLNSHRHSLLASLSICFWNDIDNCRRKQ